MIPTDTPSPSPSGTGTPAPGAPGGFTTSSPPPPGIDPGFPAYDAANGVTPTGTGPWWTDRANSMTVMTNGSYHPDGQKEMKLGDIMYWFFQWDQKKVDALASKLVKAGMLPGINVTRNDVWEVFRKGVLMDAATAYAANPGKAPTVEQFLQGFMKRPVGDSAGENKPKSYTTTNTQTSISDPTEADGIFVDALKQRLGRAPTDAEKHSFLAALNAAQRANPTKTTTQYTLDEKTGGYNTTTGTTTGGVNAGQFADDFTMKNNKSEFGANQAATTYFDAMMSALGAPGGV